MINKIAILTSGNPSTVKDINDFFKEGNRVAIDCVISTTDSPTLQSNLEESGIPLFIFPTEVWQTSPETIIDFLRSREISLLWLDDFNLPLPVEMLDAYPRTILSYRKDMTNLSIVRLNSEGESIIMSEKIENAGFLPQRAIVSVLTAPLHTKTPPPIPTDTNTPPSIEQQWADKLGININPEKSTQSDDTMPESVRQAPPCPYDRKETAEPMPPTNLVWAILSLFFCCFIPAIVAIIFSAQVSNRYYSGDIEGSKRASRNVEIWIIISIVAGIISSTLYIPISMLMM